MHRARMPPFLIQATAAVDPLIWHVFDRVAPMSKHRQCSGVPKLAGRILRLRSRSSAALLAENDNEVPKSRARAQ